MGKIEKGVKCSVVNCSEMAVRSISVEKIAAAGLRLSDTKHGYLCELHYKEYKKKSRDDRRVEKWRWSV
jgi:hypothetical protein